MTHSTLIKYLGKRVAALRKAKSLSQFEFADASGKMINTVSKIERGLTDPKVSTLEAFAKVLGVNTSQLLSEAETLQHLSPSIEMIVRLLETENEKVQKAALKQIEILLSIKNNSNI